MTALLEPTVIPGEPEFQLPGDGILAPSSLELPLSSTACGVCGASRVDGQDWCLECGTALAASRAIPGVQTVALAGAFTLLLASGAVAAGVAAINDTLPKQKTEVKVVAQTANEVPVDSDPVPLDDPVPSDGGSGSDLAPIDSGSSPVPAPIPTPTPTPTPTPAPAHPEIPLSAGDLSLYDPEDNAIPPLDEEFQNAIGSEKTPTWQVTTAAGTPPDTTDVMDVGLNVELGGSKKVAKLKLWTDSPGFTMKVYGTASSSLPQTWPDDQWTLLREAKAVGGESDDYSLSLSLGSQSKKWRNIVLWFTTPPDGDPSVHLSKLKLYR